MSEEEDKARIAELEAGLKLAAEDMQRATDETAKIFAEKGAEITALVEILQTVTDHLNTANEILLAEGVTHEDEDYADEKAVCDEAYGLLHKYVRKKLEQTLEDDLSDPKD